MPNEDETFLMALEIGREVWQDYLFPQVKEYCNSRGVEDTNTAVEAVRLWLNIHADMNRREG